MRVLYSKSRNKLTDAAATVRSRLLRSWDVPSLERVRAISLSLSPGDTLLFSVLAVLLVLASIASLYALEQSLLVTVPAYGGSLVEGEVGSPRFINPLLALSDADRDLVSLTYSGLLGLSGSGDLMPVLAERYDVSQDGKTYTFIIREDAVFSDGTPVTSRDVVMTVERAQDPALKSPEYANWAGIRVTELDSRTVRFSLPKAYAPFLQLATIGILPSRLWQQISDEQFPFSDLQTNPIGAGPFKVTSVSRDASGLIQSIKLSANALYVLGRPYLDSITFRFYPRLDDLSNAMKSGVIESAYGIPATNAGKRMLTAPYARIFGVFWNSDENPVYARVEVRKALSFAINRAKIISSVLGGYASPIMGPIPPGGGIHPTAPVSPTDPTKAAAEILGQSGWNYDGESRVWKNKSGKLTFGNIAIRTSNVPELKSVASAVKSDWEKLGIAVSIELYEPGDLSQNVIRPRKYEALLYGMVVGRDQDIYAFWSSQERKDPGLNIALYANKTVDGLLEKARSASDQKERLAAIQKTESVISDDYPAAFLYAPSFSYAVPANLLGVTLPQITMPADRFAAAASWYRVTDSVWPFFANKNTNN